MTRALVSDVTKFSICPCIRSLTGKSNVLALVVETFFLSPTYICSTGLLKRTSSANYILVYYYLTIIYIMRQMLVLLGSQLCPRVNAHFLCDDNLS